MCTNGIQGDGDSLPCPSHSGVHTLGVKNCRIMEGINNLTGDALATPHFPSHALSTLLHSTCTDLPPKAATLEGPERGQNVVRAIGIVAVLVRAARHVHIDAEGGPAIGPHLAHVRLHVHAEPPVDILHKVREPVGDVGDAAHVAVHVDAESRCSCILSLRDQHVPAVLPMEGHHA